MDRHDMHPIENFNTPLLPPGYARLGHRQHRFMVADLRDAGDHR